jgi:hypothetical protein
MAKHEVFSWTARVLFGFTSLFLFWSFQQFQAAGDRLEAILDKDGVDLAFHVLAHYQRVNGLLTFAVGILVFAGVIMLSRQNRA